MTNIKENIMNCTEFKQFALTEPKRLDVSFLQHKQACLDCADLLGDIKKMDSDLAQSLSVDIPADLIARLKLNQELVADVEKNQKVRYFSIAVSILAVFVGLFVLNSFRLNNTISHDYQSLLVGVSKHMHEAPVTQVWSNEKVNKSARVLLANYDSTMKLKSLQGLRFSRICPMGQYKGLHAVLQTKNGVVNFAYIKGQPLDDQRDSIHNGYHTRIKPLKNGNLIIISESKTDLDEANHQLAGAIYWDI